MTTLREAAQQALEALEDYKYAEARDALRAALAEPVQECPHGVTDGNCKECYEQSTAPPQRKPLTEEEISNIWDGHIVPVFGKNGINPVVFARAIERAHGIGGQL